MEELTLAVPGMWADHHVLTVIDVLREEPGVTTVAASALDGTVHLLYDPKLADSAGIAERLGAAGYAVGAAPDAAAAPRSKPEWSGTALRTTTTDPADLAMSGDHRKY